MELLRHVGGQLLALVAMSALAWAAGRPVSRRLAGAPGGLGWALGLALLAQMLLLLGMVGGLRLALLAPLLAGLAVTSLRGARAPIPSDWLSPAHWLGVGLALPAFALTLYPPLGFDQTLYHLPFTQAFAATGGVPFLPNLRFPVFPQLAEVLATPLLLLAGDTATQLVGFAALGAVLALVHAWAREHAPAAAWLAPAVLLGSPGVLYLSTCGYVEPVLALFGVGALYGAERGRKEAGLGWVAAAGFLAGSAAGVKYLGLLFLPAAALLLLRREPWRRGAVRGGLFALVALAALAPSYGRLLAHTGNPLFPFYPAVFGDNPWAADLFFGPRGPERFAKAATLLWDITFDRRSAGGLPPFSPAFVLGLPLALLAALRRPEVRRLALVAAGFVVMSPTNSHYFLGIAPLWALLVAIGAAELLGERRRLLAGVTLTVALAGPAWAIDRLAHFGLPPASAAERHVFLAERLPLYPALAFLNRVADGAPVYAVTAENLVAYSRGPLLGDTNGPRSFTRAQERLAALGSLAAVLGEMDVRYLLLSRKASTWLQWAAADPRLAKRYEDAEAVAFEVRGDRPARRPAATR